MNDNTEAPELTAIATHHDCFNCKVVLAEDTHLGESVPSRYKVYQERKDVITDYLSLEDAEEKVTEFLNDTMF